MSLHYKRLFELILGDKVITSVFNQKIIHFMNGRFIYAMPLFFPVVVLVVARMKDLISGLTCHQLFFVQYQRAREW